MGLSCKLETWNIPKGIDFALKFMILPKPDKWSVRF